MQSSLQFSEQELELVAIIVDHGLRLKTADVCIFQITPEWNFKHNLLAEDTRSEK